MSCSKAQSQYWSVGTLGVVESENNSALPRSIEANVKNVSPSKAIKPRSPMTTSRIDPRRDVVFTTFRVCTRRVRPQRPALRRELEYRMTLLQSVNRKPLSESRKNKSEPAVADDSVVEQRLYDGDVANLVA